MTSVNPQLGVSFRAQLQSNPGLKQDLEKQVQDKIKTGGTAGVLDSGEYKQLQTEFLQKMGVTDPAQATPDQLKAVESMIADALDGSIDGQNQVQDSQTVVSELARSAKESSEFDPVGFQIETPTQPAASGNASPPQVLKSSRLSQSGMIQNLFAADKGTLAEKMLDRLLAKPQDIPANEMSELLKLVKEHRQQETGKVREAVLNKAQELLGKNEIPENSKKVLKQALEALQAKPGDPEALEKLSDLVDQLGTDPQAAIAPPETPIPVPAAEEDIPVGGADAAPTDAAPTDAAPTDAAPTDAAPTEATAADKALEATAAKLAAAETPASERQAVLTDLMGKLDASKFADPEQGKMLALILEHGSPAEKTQAMAKLLGPHKDNSAALVKIYNGVSRGRESLQLKSSVMQVLATEHFAKLDGPNAHKMRFDLLMGVDDKAPPANDLDPSPHPAANLRILLQTLRQKGPDGKLTEKSKADLNAIKALAGNLVAQAAQQQQNSINNNAGTTIGGVVVGGNGSGNLTHTTITDADVAKANRIIKIVDWLLKEDAVTTAPPVITNPPVTANPPVSEKPPVTPGGDPPVAPPVVAPPPSDTDTVEPVVPPVEVTPPPADFSTQNFLERMRQFREDRDMDKLLKDLNEADQLKMVRLLDEAADGDFKKPPGTAETLPVPSKDEAKKALEAMLPKLQTLSPATRGQMVAQLLDKGTSPDMAMSLIRQAKDEGKLPELMSNLRMNGKDLSAEIPKQLSNEDAGKVLAWMVTSEGGSRENADQISKTVRELSNYLVQDDNITRAFMRELQDFASRPGNAEKGLGIIKEHLGQDLVKKLTENLDRGWVTATDRDFMLKLAASAGTQMGNQQIQQLLKVGDYRNALEIMQRSSDSDLASILASADQSKLKAAFNSNPEAFAQTLERLERQSGSMAPGDRAALQSNLNALIAEMPIDKLRQSWNTLARDSKLELGDGSREALLARFAESNDFEAVKTLLQGGQGLAPAAGASRNRMLDTVSAQITKIKDVNKAGEALSWVLEGGNRSQIERAFKNVSQDSWFGPRKGEIVNAAMTLGKDKLKGKLSLDTIQYMAGALNNFSAKVGAKMPGFVRDTFGMGDFNKNVQNIRALAELGSRDAKSAIMRDLMDYWTPAQSETLIHDILRDSAKTGDLKPLVDSLGTTNLNGAQRLSDELEDRGELGRIMATVLENYGPGTDLAINDIMGRWSSTSIKSDDFVHNMLKGLEPDAAKKLADKLSAETLKKMIDWSDDAFRDGNALSLDKESQWSLDILQAALRLKGQ
ncbi:MAG: hypothetical protein IV090_22750 [Candidatus Sericytochromatia bacterium]|nr:hypothetical protein [Candidatus Sericytochromatia bacterium]